MKTRYIALKRAPSGMPALDDFQIVETELPDLKPGEALIENLYMSVDPYMRGMMRAGASDPPAPLSGGAVGRVVRSRLDGLPEGCVLLTSSGWREHFVTDSAGHERVYEPAAPLSAYLGALGMPGFTGWYGLNRIGRPKEGETLVVSAGAGAVGSLVGQLGKRAGCRVVGVVGSEEKRQHALKTLGYDAALNWRKGGLGAALSEACPDGIDIYFENVGGALLEAVLDRVNFGARIPVCGMISQYNLKEPEPGPSNLFQLIGRRAEMKGFIISDHGQWKPQFLEEVAPLIADGSVHYSETISDGLESAPQAFIDLFLGRNIGKMAVKLSDEA